MLSLMAKSSRLMEGVFENGRPQSSWVFSSYQTLARKYVQEFKLLSDMPFVIVSP